MQKKSITYKIFSVPVASTFTPTKGTAARVEKARPIQAFDSYATLGVGNYTSAFAEFYTNFEINRGENFGINFKHNSAQGGIDDVLLDDNYYDTNLGLDYSFRDRDLSYTIGLDALHKQYNWYGFSNNIIVTNDNLNRTDVVQNYFGAGLRANLSLNDSFLDQTRFGLSVFGDSYGSSEINATLKPEMEFALHCSFHVQISYPGGAMNIADPMTGTFLCIGFSKNFQKWLKYVLCSLKIREIEFLTSYIEHLDTTKIIQNEF